MKFLERRMSEIPALLEPSLQESMPLKVDKKLTLFIIDKLDVNHLQKVFLDYNYNIQVEMNVNLYIKETTRLVWLQVHFLSY